MKTSDVAKWNESEWKRRVRYAMPSGGGAVGVVFVWADKEPIKPNPRPHTSSFVIKPSQGSAAPTKFAEYVLAKVSGAASPHSKGVAHTQDQSANRGKYIEDMLQRFKDTETDEAISNRWIQVWSSYKTATAYLIQETQQGVREFGDEYRCLWGLSTLLANDTLMANLGRLFVADAMIGNGDRLCSPNTGNIMFKANGTICSIDSSTILVNYNAVLKDITQSSWMNDEASPTPGGWAKGVVKTGTNAVPSNAQMNDYGKGIAPKVAPSFQMDVMFEPAKWWENVFKSHLQHGLQTADMASQEPEDYEWDRGKTAFLRGVDKGQKELDSRLSGLNWMMLKSNYKKYVSRYGGDPNLDWTNFKVRRLYYKLRRKGLDQEQAMAEVNAYAKRKLG